MVEDIELETDYIAVYRDLATLSRSRYITVDTLAVARRRVRQSLHALLMAGYCRADVRELQARVTEVGA